MTAGKVLSSKLFNVQFYLSRHVEKFIMYKEIKHNKVLTINMQTVDSVEFIKPIPEKSN